MPTNKNGDGAASELCPFALPLYNTRLLPVTDMIIASAMFAWPDDLTVYLTLPKVETTARE